MKAKFKHGLAMMAGASAIFLASPALAKTWPLGQLIPGEVTGAGGPIATPSNPTDLITFSIGTILDVGSTTQSTAPIHIHGIFSGLGSLTAKFYKVGDPTLLGQMADGGSLTLLNLVTGNYYVDVTATPLPGATGGTYSLSLLATPAASAPGPAGFLFVGGAAALMARRRRRQQAKLALA